MALVAITMPTVLYAAYCDYIRREIPDKVHLVLVVIGIAEIILSYTMGFFILPLSQRLIGIFLPAAVLFPLYCVNPNLSGGGDLKLFSSMGFAVGIYRLAAVLTIACISGLVYCVITKEKSVPMAVHVMIGSVVILLWEGKEICYMYYQVG